jgi:FtsP/CotA-like multicopper oxidase with cupredoxin domain
VQPLSRRSALRLGGLGLACTAVGGTGLAWAARAGFDPRADEDLVEPRLLRSRGGSLQVRLEASQGPARVAGREATVLRYNGQLPGPTLHVQPGDLLQVELVNQMAVPTNLHVHGLQVSPAGRADNVFVAVGPGSSHRYEYRLPRDHPPGLYWYHPHHHGMVADQVFAGLYGAIVVDAASDAALLPVSRERVLVVSDTSLDGAGRVRPTSAMERMRGREGELVLVNGQVRPALVARPGERERWRVLNACVARFLRLRVDGQHLQLAGMDSGRFRTPADVEELVLAPGNRADLLVTTAAGTSQLRALPYDRGGPGGMGARTTGSAAPVVLATVRVGGNAGPALPPVPIQPTPRDLRGADVARRRELTFAMGMGVGMGPGGVGPGKGSGPGGGPGNDGGTGGGPGAGPRGMQFTIDGRSYDPGRVDQSVRIGTVEEWVFRNRSPMDHPLHLHVWPMQVVQRDAVAVSAPTWQDVVIVPARSQVTVRIAFDRFAGRTVYHCHVLDHEDLGMMGVLEVR